MQRSGFLQNTVLGTTSEDMKYLLLILKFVICLFAIAGISLLSIIFDPLNSMEETKIQKVKQDLADLEVAMKLYYLDNGVLPTNSQGLKALTSFPIEPPFPKNYKEGGYMENLPVDSWNKDYQYLSFDIDGKRKYLIWSTGQGLMLANWMEIPSNSVQSLRSL